jgi:phosphoglycerate transporter family protein
MTQTTQPASALEPVFQTAGAEINKNQLYRYWQIRVLYSLMFGYAAFYLVRQNFTVATPLLISEFGYTRTELGGIAAVWQIVYGIGKFLNGYISDRSNSRKFMTLGLLASALTCLFMGFGTGYWVFMILWALNGWVQSMGWPPVAKLLPRWFSPTELGTVWGIANVSHQIGGAIIVGLSGFLIPLYGWRGLFILPALFSLVMAVFLFERLRDTPKSLGLDSIEVHRGLIAKEDEVEDETDDMTPMEVARSLLKSRNLWYVCLANMFLYIVRMGVLTWAPTFLKEHKGAEFITAGLQVCSFDMAGMVGGVVAGWLSDRVFKGRRGPVSFFFMVALVFALIYFWTIPAGYHYLNAIAMIFVGFFVYGPQVLVGVAAADFSSKKTVGMAVGLTGTFAYIGSALSAVIVGWLADHYGWNAGFIFFICAAILSCLCFLMTWSARAAILEKMNE